MTARKIADIPDHPINAWRQRIKDSPILKLVRETDPSKRPTWGTCPCGEPFRIPAKGKIPVYCDARECRGRWRCQRCGTVPSEDRKKAAIADGIREIPCEEENCKGIAEAIAGPEQTHCPGFDGPCPTGAVIKPYSLKPRVARLRNGEPARCPSCASCKAAAAMTPQQRSERGRKMNAALTPQQRSEIARKMNAAMTPEQRSERGRKAAAATNAAMTPQQRSENARKANAALTPEQRREKARGAMT